MCVRRRGLRETAEPEYTGSVQSFSVGNESAFTQLFISSLNMYARPAGQRRDSDIVPIFRELKPRVCVRWGKGCRRGNPQSHYRASSTK